MSKTLKQKLEAIKIDKENLYTHLTSVLRQLLLDNPKNAYDLFQEYSFLIKNKLNLNFEQSKLIRQNYAQLKSYVEKTNVLINKPNVGTQQQPSQPGPAGYIPNFLEESKWFEYAGVGFGEELTYKIFKSLQRFCILKQIKQLKFWGKIIGQKNDYYIAQGGVSQSSNQEVGEPPDTQPLCQGVNKLNYWVSTDLNGDWIELPIIRPRQVRISRKIKYFFTGDLEAPVIRNPNFVGKQKHLLKCQIVRIVASSTIIPRTMYNINADDKKQIELVQDWKFPSFTFLSSLENWVHLMPNILKNGRFSHLKPEIPQGQQIDEQKLMKKIQSEDPFQERLKPISKDKFLKIPPWKLNTYGDSENYKIGKNSDVNYGFISIKSNVWRGFTHIYHNKQWTSIYIGYGHKSSEGIYFPYEPQNILQQSTDKNQQHEPNFPPQQQKKQQQPKEALEQPPQQS